MKWVIKTFKLFMRNSKFNKAHEYITENLKVYQINKDEPTKSSYIPIFLYKHQRKLLRYMVAFDRLLLVKSKQIGGTLTVSAYLIYLCLTRNNQNIFICAKSERELASLKGQIFGILSQVQNFGIQGSDQGVDFQNNSQITFVTEDNLKKHKQTICKLQNVILYFDDINTCKSLNVSDLKSLLIYDDIKCIISATSTITPTIEWLWTKQGSYKIKRFQILLINAYKLNFSRKYKGVKNANNN